MYISCVHSSQTTPFLRCSDSFSYVTVREGNPGQVQIPVVRDPGCLKKLGPQPREEFPEQNTPWFGVPDREIPQGSGYPGRAHLKRDFKI